MTKTAFIEQAISAGWIPQKSPAGQRRLFKGKKRLRLEKTYGFLDNYNGEVWQTEGIFSFAKMQVNPFI
uniref:Uncharacterized protein n=1 Tax=viral metagenome TaxID=1070528 RepID=A0A6M3ITY9_9ZZZZ